MSPHPPPCVPLTLCLSTAQQVYLAITHTAFFRPHTMSPDARLFQTKNRVRFPGKLLRHVRPSARANNAHKIPKYIRTTAKLAGLDVLTLLGNYICEWLVWPICFSSF